MPNQVGAISCFLLIRLEQASGRNIDFFAPKSLSAVFKSSVTVSTHLKRGVSFASFLHVVKGPNVI